MEAKIYVACLASYNAGTLFGKWIEANQTAEEIQEEIAEMLKNSPEIGAEEWAVHDFDGFGSINLGEYPNLERVSKIAALLEEYGDAFSLWYCHQDGSYVEIEEMEERFNEQCHGAHDSKEAFADYLLDSTGGLDSVPEWVRNYFDYQAYARDLEFDGSYSFVSANGQVYVYSCA